MRALMLALGLAGCTTRITTAPDARIYVDGAYVGTGQAEISRVGLPSGVVVAVEQDGERTERRFDRSFTIGTFFIGMATVYTGFFWGWQLPDEIVLKPEGSNPWLRKKTENPWVQPQPGDHF